MAITTTATIQLPKRVMLSSSGPGLCFSRAQWPLKPIFGDKKILLFSYKSYAVIPVIIIVKTLADFMASFPFNVDFQGVYAQVNPSNQYLGGKRGEPHVCLYNVESPVFFFIFIFSRRVSSNYNRDCGHPRAVSEHWAPFNFS